MVLSATINNPSDAELHAGPKRMLVLARRARWLSPAACHCLRGSPRRAHDTQTASAIGSDLLPTKTGQPAAHGGHSPDTRTLASARVVALATDRTTVSGPAPPLSQDRRLVTRCRESHSPSLAYAVTTYTLTLRPPPLRCPSYISLTRHLQGNDSLAPLTTSCDLGAKLQMS